MSHPGLVAAGHPETARAAAEVLRAGGNAVDAVLAAGFTAAVAEPCLTSPAGGGFLIARRATGEVRCFDFFVAVPGIGSTAAHDPTHLDAVPVHFEQAVQVFWGGPASVATPGCLAGYLGVHEELGRLPLDAVVAPAVTAARHGVEVNPFVAQVVGLLEELLARTAEGRALFLPRGRPLAAGERFTNPDLGDFLAEVGSGRIRGFTPGQLGGQVTGDDLETYRVVERPPMRIDHDGAVVWTNPPPSRGGELIGYALGLLAAGGDPADPVERLVQLVDVLVAQSARRRAGPPMATRGTTHVSVADAEGNVAAMTTSNGSGSGEFAPGTGIQLNNMMGEEDLHPLGFGTLTPGDRIGSMMAPTVIELADGTVAALGSGGSERIRAVLTQVVAALTDHHRDLRTAVETPRAHWDDAVLQLEPGWPAEAVAAVAADREVVEWPRPDLYFGGVHAVRWPLAAVGDPRRGGVGIVVD